MSTTSQNRKPKGIYRTLTEGQPLLFKLFVIPFIPLMWIADHTPNEGGDRQAVEAEAAMRRWHRESAMAAQFTARPRQNS